MATITAADVNKLRQQTGAGMMDCRKALVESEGDFEKAVDYLRKKGAKVAALRSDREAKEGAVIAKTNAEGTRGIIINLSCETDFVAKNEDFISFANAITDTALAANVQSLEELQSTSFEGATIQEKVLEQVAKIGEKISVSRFESLEAPGVVAYIHAGNRMGVLAGLNKKLTPEIESAGKDVAMQIAAMNPVAVDMNTVPAEITDREKNIVMEQIKNDPKMNGKPEAMLAKIAEGKLHAFFKENTLMAQSFVKNSEQTVSDFLKSVDTGLTVTGFKRVALG